MIRSISRRRLGAVTVAAVSAALVTVAPATAAVHTANDPAPLVGARADGVIAGRYIVVMKDQARSESATTLTRQARKAAHARGGKDFTTFSHVLNGFTGTLNASALKAVRNDPDVDFVEADRVVHATGDQSSPPWGLDRIDQRNLPLSNSYHYDQTGAGVTAYIIDTGVLSTHSQLSGRVASGYSAIGDGRGTTDCNGHGTHVAGTVGGSTYGVAKGVTIVPVRVLDCSGSGTNSGVIAGIDWVTSNHAAGTPAVANMSLGGSASSAVDTAVNNSIADGVTYAVAAGNDGANACNGSPSRVPNAITVGATDRTDARASWSNYGSCLDLFAPGVDITSSWYSSTTATNTISGTSMATPHVTGTAALYLQAHPSATPAQVAAALVANATSGAVTSPGSGSPNKLLYSLWSGGTDPTPTPTPTPTQPPSGGNLLANPGFEAGNTTWSASSGVITSDSGAPAHAGSWKAWLDGYGNSHTDTLSQSVAIPSSGTPTLSFWLYVSSAETTTSTAYDKLTVQVVSGSTTTTLGTFSNLDEAGYAQKSLSLSSFKGKTVTIKITGTEDGSLATSFVVDDTAVTVS